jgi:predicted Zn-dependent protease
VIEHGRAWYSLQDVMALRTVARLTAARVPAVHVRDALRAATDELTLKKPLLEMRLHALGGRLARVEDGMLIEPASGQRLLDLDGVAEPTRSVRSMRSSDDLLASAMGADLDPTTWSQAACAYRQILERDPQHLVALVNLGTLEFKRGNLEEAEAAWRDALALAPRNPAVLFNLANVLDEAGHPEEALTHLLAAVAIDPGHGDSRFNLGLLLERQGRFEEACPHWLAYLRLDPDSEWSSLARRHLERHRVVPLARR